MRKLFERSWQDQDDDPRNPWQEALKYGSASANKLGIRTEDDVVRMIHDFRREKRDGKIVPRG
jgi:hypothetical protein